MSTQDFGSVALQVDSQVLRRQAAEVEQKINRMAQRFREMDEIVRRSERYWIGEAGEQHRQAYRKDSEAAEQMLQRLRGYPPDLLKISHNYEETEEGVASAASSLKTNVLH